MQNKERNSDLKAEESRRQKYDADSGNDDSLNDILQKEMLIDPGNEHHHSGENVNLLPQHDADSGNDSTDTTGPEPGKAENDERDVSSENG